MGIYPLTKKRSRRAALAPMIGPVLAALFLAAASTSCQNPPPLIGPTSPASGTPGLATATAGPQGEILIADRARAVSDASAAEIQALVAGNNAFAFDLYQAIRDGEENLLYSPFSISQALAMLYAGAQGETAQQMAETLHFALPQERLHSAFNALDRRLVSQDQATGSQTLSPCTLPTRFGDRRGWPTGTSFSLHWRRTTAPVYASPISKATPLQLSKLSIAGPTMKRKVAFRRS